MLSLKGFHFISETGLLWPETYQSMIDEEFSKIIAKGQNFGIAEALVRQFGKNWSKD